MKSFLLLTFLSMGLCAALVPAADKVIDRFKVPVGYHQVPVEAGSFGAWLQQLPLKPAGTHTLTYNGQIARTDPYTAAVVDISVGNEDLQQCADVVMRLRGEYLYQQKRYSDIVFHFSDGFRCDYMHYANGYRYRKGQWVLKAPKDFGYNTFMQYMRLVFEYAGTLTLQAELKPVSDAHQLKAGDVFIHGGSPGHCFIILDVVEDAAHHKQFLIAQSFMPAQNLQILQPAGSSQPSGSAAAGGAGVAGISAAWFSLENGSGAAIPYGELVSATYLKKFE